MPHDQAEADQLASPHLDGANDRAAFGAVPSATVKLWRVDDFIGKPLGRSG